MWYFCDKNVIFCCKMHYLVAVGDRCGLVARLWHDVGGVALGLEKCVAHDVVWTAMQQI